MARMNENQLRQEIKRRINDMIKQGANLDPAKVDALDINAIAADMATRWTYQLWDKTSPVNGVDAATVIERYNIAPTDSVFMLLKDGQVIIFQPFDASAGGRAKMTPATVNQIAQDALDDQINQAVMDEVYPLVTVAAPTVEGSPDGI